MAHTSHTRWLWLISSQGPQSSSPASGDSQMALLCLLDLPPPPLAKVTHGLAQRGYPGCICRLAAETECPQCRLSPGVAS